MKPRAFVAAALGEFSWRSPTWLLQVGLRRAGYGALALVGLLALAVGGYIYYQNLPKPLRVAVDVDPPGVSRIERDELVWDPLHLDFHYLLTGTEDEAPPTLSAARLDLVGDILEEGIELDPPLSGEWRFETENRLVFKASEDRPYLRR